MEKEILDRLTLLECRVGALENNLIITETLSRMSTEMSAKGFQESVATIKEVINEVKNLKDSIKKE